MASSVSTVPTHVDNDSLTKVVVVRDGLEVRDAGELCVWRRPVVVLTAEFGQRPAGIAQPLEHYNNFPSRKQF